MNHLLAIEVTPMKADLAIRNEKRSTAACRVQAQHLGKVAIKGAAAISTLRHQSNLRSSSRNVQVDDDRQVVRPNVRSSSHLGYPD